MNENFQKFKRRAAVMRVLRALMAGLSVGALASGVLLALSRLNLIAPTPILALPVGGCAFAVAFSVVYLLLGISERRLARKLDEQLSLYERVQTAVEFKDRAGGMIELQRADTERVLGELPARALRVRGLWVYVLVFVLGVGTLAAAFFAPYRRDYVPPAPVIPFEVSEVQIAGIEELSRYVEDSPMQEPWRGETLSALHALLSELRVATTEPEMEAALAKALTAITETTYDASSMTEILDALWRTEEPTVRLLATALYTGDWTEPDWGDFAESYSALGAAFAADETAEDPAAALRWKVESFSLKVSGALGSSGIDPSDPLYGVIDRLLGAGENLPEELLPMAEEIFGVISAQKLNTNVGEYVLKKLCALFGIPIPAFERPDLRESGGSTEDSDREDEESSNGGGVGEGAVFGSDDLILDPRTGEYVTYGTLYASYNTLMLEKLSDGTYGYTEEQKTAIEKYFALLYGGFQKEEED